MNPKQSPKRALPLTEIQKSIILENTEIFDSDICKLPGMERTTVRQIADYRKRITRPSTSDHRALADHLTEYIKNHGLPAKFGDVMGYINYLREQG